MLLIKRHTLLICAAKGNSEKLLGNLIFFECKKILQSFSIIIKIFRRPKGGEKICCPGAPKRGGIRETVGFDGGKCKGCAGGFIVYIRGGLW